MIVVSLIFFAITLVTVYSHTSSFMGNLEKAKRDVRICGSHAFERENVRFIALSSVDTNRQLYHGILITFAVITIALAVADRVMYKHKYLSWTDNAIPLAIILLTIPLVITGYYHFTKKNLFISKVKQYQSTLKTVEKIFAHKTDNTTAWVRYHEVLLKRVSRDQNLYSVKDAEDYIKNLIDDQNYRELVGFVEFATDRDYSMLKDLAATIPRKETRADIENAIEKLSITSQYDPIKSYQTYFTPVYVFVCLGAFLCGYLFHRMLIHLFGIPYTLSLFSCIVVMSLFYTAWTGWKSQKI